MNEYMYSLAQQAVEAAKEYDINNLDPRWIYAQWAHESNGFTSQLFVENKNSGGLCQKEQNDSPQPDGDEYYIKFDSYEDYAVYFGHYLRYFKDGGVDTATNLQEYVHALKFSPSGEYFGDDYDSYLANCEMRYEQELGVA